MPRLPSGLTQSRYPSRVTQMITPFALWWVGMVHDYALWRDDAALVRELLPGVRAVIDGFGRFLNAEGIVQAPAGWNFMDWAPDPNETVMNTQFDGVAGRAAAHPIGQSRDQFSTVGGGTEEDGARRKLAADLLQSVEGRFRLIVDQLGLVRRDHEIGPGRDPHVQFGIVFADGDGGNDGGGNSVG